MAGDAGLLGKDNWKAYGPIMYAWRAVTMCCRFMFADLMTVGHLTYTEDELGGMGRRSRCPRMRPRWRRGRRPSACPHVEPTRIVDPDSVPLDAPFEDEPPWDEGTEPGESGDAGEEPASPPPPSLPRSPGRPNAPSAAAASSTAATTPTGQPRNYPTSPAPTGNARRQPRKNGQGNFPWGSYDKDAFSPTPGAPARPRQRESQPKKVEPADVKSLTLGEARRLLGQADRIVQEAPVGKVEQHVGAIVGRSPWPDGGRPGGRRPPSNCSPVRSVPTLNGSPTVSRRRSR